MELSKEINIAVMEEDKNTPTALRLLACKCPRCRKGDMFVHKNPWKLNSTMKMHKDCPVCKQPFDIEVGFYYGSSYISYAFTIAISMLTLVMWWMTIGFSVDDNRIFYWLGFNSFFLVLLQPYLMRVSRTGWLAFFVRYNKNWKTMPPGRLERTNKTHQANW
ncbi:MAG: DUF983 domain-containing protein [Sphingobacteriales bacterium]|nr:MAG: DUF983 domain-containing protein [Sphingobacteriales bacterium]